MGISVSDPGFFVTSIWYVTCFFVFIFSIGTIVFASQNDDGDSSDAGAVGFAGVWTMLLAIFLSVGGTFVLRRFKTPLAVGFLLGVVTIMAINMVVLCALLDAEEGNCQGLNDRLDDGIDSCQAVGCQKAGFNSDGEANSFVVCCQTMQAYKYGDNANSYAFRFGEGHEYTEGGATTVAATMCPECNKGECEGAVFAAVFAIFLFLLYSAFGIALGYYRSEIIVTGTEEAAAEDTAEKGDAVAYPVADPSDVEMDEKKDLSE